MRVLSVYVGSPRQVSVGESAVLTGIFKSPVEGRVTLVGCNLAGDRQADLRAHGGPHKAVYLYPSEHYEYWARELPEAGLPFGVFGENLTTVGILENEVRIGDQFRIGSAILQAAQPRVPCYKLGIRFGREDMAKLFWLSGRSGIYFSVAKEGELGAGDRIEQVAVGPEAITVADVVRLYCGDERDPEKLDRALRSPLRGGWKSELEERNRNCRR